jgi:hypothetical protein
MLLGIRALLFKAAREKSPSVPQFTATQIAEQLAEELHRPLALLVDATIADNDHTDCDGSDRDDDDVIDENDVQPNAKPGEVAAAGAAAASQGDDCQKAARKLRREPRKLEKADLSEFNPAAKTAIEKQALDLTLALGTKDFSPENLLQFNRRFNGGFKNTLLITGMLLESANRCVLTPKFVDETQIDHLKSVLNIELTSHIATRTTQDIAGVVPDVMTAPAPAAAAAAAAAAGGGSPPPPKRVSGLRESRAPYTSTVIALPAETLAKGEIDLYWSLSDSGDTPALHL